MEARSCAAVRVHLRGTWVARSVTHTRRHREDAGRQEWAINCPDQFHRLDRPSFLKDRAERILRWYDAHLS